MSAQPIEILWTLIVVPGMVRSLQNVLWSRQIEAANAPYVNSTDRVKRAAWIHAHSTKLINWGLLACETLLALVGVIAMLRPPTPSSQGTGTIALQVLLLLFAVILTWVSDYSHRVSRQLEHELLANGGNGIERRTE